MKRVWFAVGIAAPAFALACSGTPDDPSSTSGENLNWKGEDGGTPQFPGLPGHDDHFDGSFPFAIPDGGFPPFVRPDGGPPHFEAHDGGCQFVLPDGSAPFEIPDGGFPFAPPDGFKWGDGRFHVEPFPGAWGGFRFLLPPPGGGSACPEKGGGFKFEGPDGGFMPPPFDFDGGFGLPPFDRDGGFVPPTLPPFAEDAGAHFGFGGPGLPKRP